MKKLFSSMLILAAISFTASAQEKMDVKENKNGMHKKHHPAGKRHDEMMQTLNLSDAQKTQMKAQQQEYKKQMQALQQDQNITVKELNERKAALRKQQKAGMESLLTADQKRKMADAKMQHKADAQKRSDEKLAKMKSTLSLSDDQMSRLKAQRENMQVQRNAIKENQSLSGEQKKQQMMALKNSAKEQRKSILTAEQLKKLEESKQHSPGKDRKRARK